MTDVLRAQYLKTAGCRDTPMGVIGISMGGMIAMDWVQRHPEDFQRLVLLNTSLRNLSPCWQRLRPQVYWPVIRAALMSDPLQREPLALSLVSSLVGSPRAEAARLWNRIARECPVKKQTVLRQLLAAARFEFNARIDIPSLMLASQADRLVNPACSRAVARLLRSELRLHPSAGHDLPLDDPNWVTEQIAQWLRSAHASTATAG